MFARSEASPPATKRSWSTKRRENRLTRQRIRSEIRWSQGHEKTLSFIPSLLSFAAASMATFKMKLML